MFGKVHQGAGVRDQPGANQLADKHREVRGDRHHSVLQVLIELSSVLLDLHHLRKRMIG